MVGIVYVIHAGIAGFQLYMLIITNFDDADVIDVVMYFFVLLLL
jgi:hypothetical protein